MTLAIVKLTLVTHCTLSHPQGEGSYCGTGETRHPFRPYPLEIQSENIQPSVGQNKCFPVPCSVNESLSYIRQSTDPVVSLDVSEEVPSESVLAKSIDISSSRTSFSEDPPCSPPSPTFLDSILAHIRLPEPNSGAGTPITDHRTTDQLTGITNTPLKVSDEKDDNKPVLCRWLNCSLVS